MVEARTRCRVEHAAFPTHFAGVANKMARKGISPRAFLPTLTYVVTADWALANDGVQLNHGSYGGCPRAVLASAAGWRARLEAAPMRFMVLDWQAELDRARAALAAFVRAPDDRLVLMPNATNAVATALAAARIEAGDELLTTAHAYRACRNQLNRLAAARGARVIVAALPWQFEPAARHVARGSAGVRPSEPPARRARLDGHLRSRRALRGRDRDPDDRRPRPRVARNTRAQPRARTRAAPPPRRHARRPRRQHRRDGRISDRIAGRRDASLARRSTAARRLRGPSRRLLPRPAAARLGTPLQRAERRERARREASRTRRQTAHLVDRDGLLAALDVDLARAFGLDALRGRVRRLGYQISVASSFVLLSSRDATFTESPITVYSMRLALPMLPATTSPVCMPMPNRSAGKPRALNSSLSFASASRIRTAARTARTASSGRVTGAPHTAMMLSPMYLSTTPPSSMMISTITVKYSLRISTIW